MTTRDELIHSHIQLMTAIQDESRKFQEFYLWIEKHFPESFFEELTQDQIMLIAHNLMGLHLQNFSTHINLKNGAIVLILDSADADVQILKNYAMYGIKNYRAFISTEPFPANGVTSRLRVAIIRFTDAFGSTKDKESFPVEHVEEVRQMLKQRNIKVTDEDFNDLIAGIDSRFLHSLPPKRLSLALDMFFRAQIRDNCQYEVHFNEDWEEKNLPSVQIVLAWRNTPKHNFLYRLARMVYRHKLIMRKVNAAYIDPYEISGILIMSLGLHGQDGKAAWNSADIPDFLKELVTMKYFGSLDTIDRTLIKSKLVSGNFGNYLRTTINFVQQSLVHVDLNLYNLENIEEALCRHPELTVILCEAFEYKFNPEKVDYSLYEKTRDKFLKLIDKLDTGREVNDTRRKNVFKQAMNFVEYTLKTNFFRNNKTSFAFRIDPKYLDEIPFDRKSKFPELPYAIFFVKGMHFIGFHIRFKDLARGGLRTIFPEKMEHMVVERTNVFTECYNLAYTQQKKNKDIPEGGAKGAIFLKPYQRLTSEAEILAKELKRSDVDDASIKETLERFKTDQKIEYLYQTQRSFVGSLLTLINCEDNGKLKAKHVIDYWKKPEYIYLGPDENMHNSMIEWIAHFSKKYAYKPGGAFISSKPGVGINHKEWGVTSLGVNVNMHEMLLYLGIDPHKDPFTVKISGGPDGDVAGNQIYNLYRFYKDTAKLVALTDVSGTIFDPEGLNLDEMVKLFKTEKPIKFYPPEKLSEGAFLLDRFTKRDQSAIVQQTLCWRKKNGKVIEDWLSGSDMNYLFRMNVHQAKADIFIPAGGRPRTLNKKNINDYIDDKGNPSSRAIVEGANLYLTQNARSFLEDKGVFIIKDSSANKGGVIASSFEVLIGLVLDDEEILKQKETLINEVLETLQNCARNEAQLMLRTHKETGEPLTAISEKVSECINTFTYELLDYFNSIELSKDPDDPAINCYIKYCLPSFQKKYQDRLINRVPDNHKRAIISSALAAKIIYERGISWSPGMVDILPVLWEKNSPSNKRKEPSS